MGSKVIGNALIAIRMGLDTLDRELDTAKSKVQSGLEQLGSKTQRVGIGLTKTLTPAATGMGFMFKSAFNEWDTGIDSIRAKTGLVGPELDRMGDSLERVAGKVTQPLSRVGEVMGDVAARTGLTGKPLERLTKQLLDLEKLGQMVSVESATRFFGDWSIATDKQSDSLDRLFVVSQKTGVPVEQLMDLMVQFGAPIRELGFDVDDTAVLLAKFQQEGVNTESVLAGLKISVAKFAKEGKTPAEGLSETIAKMKELGPGAEATTLAMETFGPSAGIDVAKAVEEGRFNIDALLKSVKGGKETIQSTRDDTIDWSDKLKMWKNKLQAVLGPIGELGMGVAGVAAGLGPGLVLGGKFMKVIGKLAPVTKIVTAAQWLWNAAMSANPIMIVVLAVAALIAGLVLAYNKIGWFRDLVDSVVNFFVTLPGKLLDIGVQIITFLWNGISSMVSWIGSQIIGFVETVVGWYVSIYTKIFQVGVGILTWLWNGIVSVVSWIGNQIIGLVSTIVNFYVGIYSKMIEVGLNIIRFLWNGISSAAGWLLGALGGIVNSIWSTISGVISLIFDVGKNIVKGIWHGIENAAGWLWNKLTGFVNDVADFISSGFGIFSPSKVTAEMGVQLVRGLGVGWNKEWDHFSPHMDLGVKGVGSGSAIYTGAGDRSMLSVPKGAMSGVPLYNPTSGDIGAVGGGTEVIRLVLDGKVLTEVVRDRQSDIGRRKGEPRTVGGG